MILEAIAITFVKFFTNMLLKAAFSNMDGIKIDGAPSWFYKSDKSKLCVYSFEKGGLEAVEKAKRDAGIRMEEKIKGIVEVVIYDNYRNINEPDEKAFIEKIKEDEYLPVFVKKNITYPRVEYKEKIKTAFVKACIANDTIIAYQAERSKKIAKNLSLFRAEKNFEELENDNMSLD
jgi:hypothetical protein